MAAPCPRIVVAGTNSGVGKTSVTLALVTALKMRGLKVQAFKVGPDYLDPTHLAVASGRPCYNLDGWMMGRDYVRRLFLNKASNVDIAVIEGVMGLFDGSDPVHSGGSTAEIASWLNAPILLVVNVHGMAGSISALVKGYSEFDPNVRIAGIVANQCGSERHSAWLRESLEAYSMPRQVASIPRRAFPALPSRHLGLVTADDRNLPDTLLEQFAESLNHHGSLDDILAIAWDAPPMEGVAMVAEPWTSPKPVSLGLAHDAAFHFYYQDNLEALEAAGCKLVRFSPLSDPVLPDGLDGVYLGGGYPEEYAETLAENRSMCEDIRAFASARKPVYAECGGLMYLSRGIRSLDGKRFDMVGLVPRWTRMLDRLKSLGYVEVTLTADSLFGRCGDKLRGHEFHYSELINPSVNKPEDQVVYKVKRMRSDSLNLEGFQYGHVLASYVHTHFASCERAVKRFVSVCSQQV
jgi:cobyrinic acid a,c-diamide synthase